MPSNRRRAPRRIAATCALLAALAFPAAAETFLVTSTADEVDAIPGDGTCQASSRECTLRAAVQEANLLAGADVIDLPAGTYSLSLTGIGEDEAATGDLDVTDDLHIAGAGAASTIIDGGGADRVIETFAGVDLTVDDLTVRAGQPNDLLVTGGSLLLQRCVVEGSSGGPGLVVGGAAVADVIACTFRGNRNSILLGGGISAGPGTVVNIVDSLLTENQADTGGGVFAAAGSRVSMLRSVIAGNVSDARGAGLVGLGGSTVTLDRCAVTGNRCLGSGGGIQMRTGATAGRLTVVDSTIAGNSARNGGGAIFIEDVQGGASAHVLVVSSTISGNTSGDAAGIYVGRAAPSGLTLVNTTVSGNTATRTVGGIYVNDGALAVLRNVTLSGNSGFSGRGGLLVAAGGTAEVANSILAGNVGFQPGDAVGTITSLGHVLIEDPTDAVIIGDTTTNLLGVSPLLGPLADNGGPTPTHDLLAGSPALDAGDPAGCTDETGAPLDVDQRGQSRPIDGDGDLTPRCDIGSVESCGADADADTLGDACDCAPGDGSAFRLPAEPVLTVEKVPGTSNALLNWTDLAPTAGSGTTYDVASDTLLALASRRVADAPCILTGLTVTTTTDATAAGPSGLYYLVRGVNACGPAALEGWGDDSLGAARPACP